jgi:hypothetical protein
VICGFVLVYRLTEFKIHLQEGFVFLHGIEVAHEVEAPNMHAPVRESLQRRFRGIAIATASHNERVDTQRLGPEQTIEKTRQVLPDDPGSGGNSQGLLTDDSLQNGLDEKTAPRTSKIHEMVDGPAVTKPVGQINVCPDGK